MKKILSVRKALEHIPDSQINFPPEEDFPGNQKGVQIDTTWKGEAAIEDRDEADLAPIDSQRFKTGRNVPEQGGSRRESPPEPVFEFGAEVDHKKPILRGEEGERTKKSIDLKGTDALACYISFHVKGAQWGIYVPTSGIAYIVQNVLGKLSANFENKCRLAFHSLLSHELFHFATDYMVAQCEMIWEKAVWTSMLQLKQKSGLRYLEREEKLANAYMLQRLRSASRWRASAGDGS